MADEVDSVCLSGHGGALMGSAILKSIIYALNSLELAKLMYTFEDQIFIYLCLFATQQQFCVIKVTEEN